MPMVYGREITLKQNWALTRQFDKDLHQFEVFVNDKAERAGKVMFNVSAANTSQAFPDCGHTVTEFYYFELLVCLL